MMDPADHDAFRDLLNSWIEREHHRLREPKALGRWLAQRAMVDLWYDIRGGRA